MKFDRQLPYEVLKLGAKSLNFVDVGVTNSRAAPPFPNKTAHFQKVKPRKEKERFY